VEIAPRITGSTGQRLLLRKALARAARTGAARRAVRQVLSDRTLPDRAAIDVLRALGRRVVGYEPDASRLLMKLLSQNPDFRTRYLLLGPASFLAAENPRARAFVSRCLTSDPIAYVRARAAQVISQPETYGRELRSAAMDAEARVREAAVQALTDPAAGFAQAVLIGRLDRDPWPFVRVAAAAALARLGLSVPADEALADALDDDSAQVKQAVIEALGRRGVRSQARALRDLLEDREEVLKVRVAAAQALGALCDLEAAPLLADFVRFLGDPVAGQEKRALGWAALKALGRLHPRDLRETLRPLLAKEGVSDVVRRAARAALLSPRACHAVR
jgi:HEAT repeat protein